MPELPCDAALHPPLCVADACRRLQRLFSAAGLETPALDARLLVQAAAAIDHARLIARPETGLNEEQRGLLKEMCRRRLAREPVSRILGHREFWSLPFALSPDVLDPRPDSETLIEAALASWLQKPPAAAGGRLLDLGTGSGCLLLALLHENPNCSGIGVDIDPAALACARANAAALGMDRRAAFISGDWLAPVSGMFDMIISNPPYIASADIGTLPPEVRQHDPRLALDGGEDGLSGYRRIIAELPPIMTDGGIVLLEIGVGQENAVGRLLMQAGLRHDPDRDVFRDLNGHIRCLRAHKTAHKHGLTC
ncbi:MAG TPA: peptide chain release factor N(5)-glutamine methyltransferase [Rhodobacteraceae bacterium]|nr:peptide chain release factor N(5)-glutamine methyltransferase [Paracoccaceae bacterium]